MHIKQWVWGAAAPKRSFWGAGGPKEKAGGLGGLQNSPSKRSHVRDPGWLPPFPRGSAVCQTLRSGGLKAPRPPPGELQLPGPPARINGEYRPKGKLRLLDKFGRCKGSAVRLANLASPKVPRDFPQSAPK